MHIQFCTNEMRSRAELQYYDVIIGQGNGFISLVKLNIASFNCFRVNCSIPKPR